MSMISDLEIIKSSMIYGEPSVTMNLIDRKISKLSYLLKFDSKKREYISEHIAMLQSFKKVLTGESNVQDLVGVLTGLKSLSSQISPDDMEFAMNTLGYCIQIALDRYNIRYPVYDSKRCDDR